MRGQSLAMRPMHLAVRPRSLWAARLGRGTDVCQLCVSVQALFSLFISVGLRSLYLQEILETGNNYENIPRPHGSSIILEMEKDGLL